MRYILTVNSPVSCFFKGRCSSDLWRVFSLLFSSCQWSLSTNRATSINFHWCRSPKPKPHISEKYKRGQPISRKNIGTVWQSNHSQQHSLLLVQDIMMWKKSPLMCYDYIIGLLRLSLCSLECWCGLYVMITQNKLLITTMQRANGDCLN